MNDLFRPHLWQFILFFFDDILIYSWTWDDHMHHLDTVFSIIATNHLHIKPFKCTFAVRTVECLGHVVSQEGVNADYAKIQAIRDWPTPTMVRQVCGFLGLAGYYRKFVWHFGTIAAPLNQLLSRYGFHWTLKTEEAFQALKQAFTTAPILRLLDFSQPFTIECDASGSGIGAILMQDN